VSLTAPASGAKFVLPATITVSAAATPPETNDTVTQVQFFANGASIGTATASPFSVSWANPTAGTYTLTAVATDGFGATTTSAARTVTIASTASPPTVSLNTPANNAIYVEPATITVSAAAAAGNTNLTLTQVRFFASGNLIGTKTTAPYSIVWTPAPGTYALTAVATDSENQTTTSAAHNVTVNATNTPPTVALTAPANNAKFNAPATITISATATPPEANDTVTQVQFFAGATLLGTVTTAPYSFTWNNVTSGTYSLTAVATDGFGATTTSAAPSITVNNPPTVTLSANPTTALAPATIALTASASSPNGNITKVDFFQGATQIGTVATAPYVFTVQNLVAGSYSFTARATDVIGVQAISVPATVTVNANLPPTVSLTSPNSGQTFIAPANIAVTANATAPNGNVAKVDFFQGTTNIGTTTISPYTITWGNVTPGRYVLTAKVTDNLGVTTTSSPIPITVNANQPPTISITSPANNATFEAPANITIDATATAPNGNVAKVDFFQAAIGQSPTNIGTVTASPYTVTWNNVTAGTYTLIAKVTDNFGINTTSNPITVTVNAGASVGYFIHSDQLGTPRAVTDQNNNLVWSWDNTDPYGANAPNQDPMATGNQFAFNPRFPGQYFDGETGLHYNYNRHYDPTGGRYIESDPIGLGGGLNTYGYVNASPILGVDATGLWGFGVFGGGSVDFEPQAGGPQSGGTYSYQASSGVGMFGNAGGFSIGTYAASRTDNSAPTSLTNWVMGASAGLTSGVFVTTAPSATDLKGPFDTWTLNTPWFSLQVATDGTNVVVSGGGGLGGGISISRVSVDTTNTWDSNYTGSGNFPNSNYTSQCIAR
jgi:RHS repeat-associated protein